MAKYEIMLLIDPKEEGQESIKMAKEIFPDFKGQVLERTELAYEINNLKTGKYIVAEVETDGEHIKEFNRKANIIKTLWRHIVINLDKEVGREGVEEKMKLHAKKIAERAAYYEAKMKDKSRSFKSREFKRS